jgi:hypothetical protein
MGLCYTLCDGFIHELVTKFRAKTSVQAKGKPKTWWKWSIYSNDSESAWKSKGDILKLQSYFESWNVMRFWIFGARIERVSLIHMIFK